MAEVWHGSRLLVEIMLDIRAPLKRRRLTALARLIAREYRVGILAAIVAAARC